MNLICKNSEPCLHPAGADTYFQEPVVILLQRQNATLTLSAKTFAWQKTNLLAASETFLQTGICSSYYINQPAALLEKVSRKPSGHGSERSEESEAESQAAISSLGKLTASFENKAAG